LTWEIKEIGYNKDQVIHFGNKFLIGNLKLGVRGTLDEYRKNEMVGINLPLIYDQVGDGWREPVNSFNPLYTYLEVDGKRIDILHQKPIYHEQALNLKNGVMSRSTTYDVSGKKITFKSERFVSLNDDRAIIGRFEITVDKDADIKLITGIDYDIWDINGPHIEDIKTISQNAYLCVHGLTHEKGYHISTSKKIKPLFNDFQVKQFQSDYILAHQYQFIARHNQSYIFEQYSVIGVNQQLEETLELIYEIEHTGYLKKLEQNEVLWDQKWEASDVVITGDDEAQIALRYSIYHLLILAPNIYEKASIPARGISGQTYKGAIFWDTEIFMLPFYLNTDLDSAKRIIEYRIEGLEGAKMKAQSYGYRGAFYAWESQEDGYDACTDYNVTDVFTNRDVRTYFKDKQIHISADIVYAIDSYINRTHDYSILYEGALEVILEVARFYLDYGCYKPLKKQFEILDVLGPDEYHERVHNNAFTNHMIKMVFDVVLKYEAYFEHAHDDYFNQMIQKLSFAEPLSLLKDYIEKFHIIKPNEEGIIEQFEGYFKLKDISKEDLLKQRIHENEYLGGHGLAGDTKIIKQADVIAMLYLFKDQYDIQTLEKNWLYYEPKTEHGSSLSASMYALVACLIGKSEYAYPLFMKSATVDLTGKSKHYAGGIYIGGTHPAASGGAYMTAIYGFSGLSFKDGIQVKPHLPKHIKSISYKVKYLNKSYKIDVYQNQHQIKEV
jgi:kojibiose phosphorylase/nigerose phosphorylase